MIQTLVNTSLLSAVRLSLSERIIRKRLRHACDSWLWILAAGCYPAPPPRRAFSGRRQPRSSIFSAGECYEIDKKRDSVGDVIASFQRFDNIMEKISDSAYHIYTDGSRDTLSLHSGAAAIIKKGHLTISSSLEFTGTETVNYAELHAVLLGLRWIAGTSLPMTQSFHFWVDSKYCFDLLTEQTLATKHFFIVQDIFQLASRLHIARGHEFTIHRISSHIETFSAGACRIEGSFEVDRLASSATKQIAPFKSIDDIRLQILNQSAQLLQRISGLIDTADDPSSDDFSAPANAEQSCSQSDSVLHPASVSAC